MFYLSGRLHHTCFVNVLKTTDRARQNFHCFLPWIKRQVGPRPMWAIQNTELRWWRFTNCLFDDSKHWFSRRPSSRDCACHTGPGKLESTDSACWMTCCAVTQVRSMHLQLFTWYTMILMSLLIEAKSTQLFTESFVYPVTPLVSVSTLNTRFFLFTKFSRLQKPYVWIWTKRGVHGWAGS